ncbi:MAG: daunorubicin/doxorubicin resistance ABC transporter ATP-binding protein DrrA [Actinobacteria bacterium 69-20]|jgi:ABC-2 type transport system ATP-binding protein|nr:ATP-binding cassette domain-containing protein [Actinomycetota bacterium]OJV25825.1 MAG: daunorubicin/doxorubicin resistance ABC transporter ATP-binding protein DrrA [Actinobacteria bacterium 69-20]
MSDSAIVAEGLVKGFGKSVRALDGVSFAVPSGTVLGLLGPNGAGKTTAVNVLTTLLLPDAGRAFVADVDVVKHPAAARRRFGLAGQYPAVDEMLTGIENLTLVGRLNHLSPHEARARGVELLDQFGLTEAARRIAKTYSGGMRRRLDLAAALICRPPVLFLDEPTTGLDPRSRIDLWGVIDELKQGGTTLLLTTQYLEEADRLADRVAVVDHGRVIAEGTPAQLKAELGGAVVEIQLENPEHTGRLREAVAGLGAGEASVNGDIATVPAEGTSTLVEVVRALDAAGLEARSLQLREPSLDDVFLALTGHAAEEAAPPDGAPGGPAAATDTAVRREVHS